MTMLCIWNTETITYPLYAISSSGACEDDGEPLLCSTISTRQNAKKITEKLHLIAKISIYSKTVIEAVVWR